MKKNDYDVVKDVFVIMKNIQRVYNLRYDWFNDYNLYEIEHLMTLAKLSDYEQEYKETMQEIEKTIERWVMKNMKFKKIMKKIRFWWSLNEELIFLYFLLVLIILFLFIPLCCNLHQY